RAADPQPPLAFDRAPQLVEHLGQHRLERRRLDVVDHDRAPPRQERQPRDPRDDEEVADDQERPGDALLDPRGAEGLEVAAHPVAEVRLTEREQQSAAEDDEARQAEQEAGEVPLPGYGSWVLVARDPG